MKSFFKKMGSWSRNHKKMSIVMFVILIGLVYGAIKVFGSDAVETRYVLAAVRKGSIVSTVSGSGQVSASDQVTLSSKASGDITSLNVKAGQEVGVNAVIAQIDAGDAYYDFETAQLSHEKLITIDPDSLRNAENAVRDAKENVEESYINARASLTSASVGMVDVMEDLKTLYNCNTGYLGGCSGYSQGDTRKNYGEKAESSWWSAKNILDEFAKKYESINSNSTKEEIESAVVSARGSAISVTEATKYAQDAVVYFRDRESDNDKTQANTAYSFVNPLVTSANSTLSDITSAYNSITSTKRSLEDAEYNLAELKKGPDTLDVRSSQLSLSQKERSLADYVIKAPFAGIIASVAAKKGDSVNSGTSIVTLITKKKMAEISLNEIDVAKIKVGQKTTLTFDAYEDLTIPGEVVEVDSIGTVSQGVVNYKVKIAFDVDDDRIKSGMSVSASITTEMKQDILVIPISAVKTQGNMHYVEVVNGNVQQPQRGQTAGVTLPVLPTRVSVVTGLSNDELIEIISGIKEGDQYVVRTITTAVGTARTTSTSAPSLFGGSGVRTGGGPSGGFISR